METEDKRMEEIPNELLQAMQANQGSAMPGQNISSNAGYQQPAQGGFMPEGSFPETQQVSDKDRMTQMAASDAKIIQNLVKAGIINPQQGQYLMNLVFEKAYNLMTKQGLMTQTQQQELTQVPVNNNFQALIENPEFYQVDGRNQVLDYLKNTNANVGKDEMSQITNMITSLEQAAIDRYLKQQQHEKTLIDENEAAKLRLRANAQKSGAGNSKGMVFTREQIGKMSGAEFAKNERLIMEQLKKGMIR